MGIGLLRPQQKTLFHFPEKALDLLVSPSDGSDETGQHKTLQTLIQTGCPSLFADFHPVWWLPNGHLQTLYNVAGNFSKQDRLWYRRHFLGLVDGGTIGLDFTPVESSHLADDTPIVVVQHGLTGGSHEPYVKAILRPACAPVEEGGLGYRAVVVTFRGCAGVPVTSPKLYTAGHTDDLRQALVYISHNYPKAPLLGLGFSLGANVMTKYVAEEGNRCRLTSALVLSCPWNMEKNGHSLVSTFLGKQVWARGMGTNLLRVVRRHQKALAQNSDHPVAKALPAALSLRLPTLPEFDSTFTKNVGDIGGPFPFATVDEYYRWSSSDHVVGNIRIPFLTINAEDDPVVRLCPMDGEGNSNVVMVLTRRGGHLGWFQSGSDGRLERWTTRPALEWLKLMGDGILLEKRTFPRVYADEKGYLKEEGQETLGIRKEDGSELIDGNARNRKLLRGL